MHGCIFISPAGHTVGFPNLKTLIFLILESFSHHLTLFDSLCHSLYFFFLLTFLLRHVGTSQPSCQFLSFFFSTTLCFCVHPGKFSQFQLSLCNFFGCVSLIFNTLSSLPFSSLISLRISKILIFIFIFIFF